MEEKNEIYRLAKATHKVRIDKNPNRLEYAVKKLNEHGIPYEIKNEETCHIHAWKAGELLQFWAGTGKILDHDERGIDNFIALLTECNNN